MSVPAASVPDPLAQFLGMLPALPAGIAVFSPAGGIVELELAGVDGRRVVGYGPQVFMKVGAVITAQLRDASGAGYDVELRVEEAYFQAGDQALLYMTVREIVQRSGERETPRAQLAETAHAQVVFSQSLATGATYEVRLADISASGVSFISDQTPVVGDRFAVEIVLNGRRVLIDSRVTRVDPAAFGRNRVGCETSLENDWDRAALERLAGQADTSSPDHRRPDMKDALAASRAEQAALQERLNMHRDSE